VSRAPALLLAALLGTGAVAAQSLNWDGQTGVFITPLAYTAASPDNNFGRPVVAFHFLNAGSVLGSFETVSVTEGLAGRAEFGYTRDLHQQGDTAGFSPLWGSGFNLVHAKVNFVKENAGRNAWLPAFSAGFVARTQDRNVSGLLATPNKSYTNADFYLVASKTITETKAVPIVLNLGYKETNASVYGLAGNAPGYKGRLFGAAALVLKGPAKSTLIFGSEFSQEPRQVQNLPGAIVPTTITYAARIVPLKEQKFNVDFGVAQAAGVIEPGVNLQARHQFALGVSYGL
jgi:hypothetical protein